MTKYTPGPWSIAPRKSDYEVADGAVRTKMIHAGLEDKMRFTCAAIEDKFGARSIALIPLDDSNMENASLIAAAPELLEALKEIRMTTKYTDSDYFSKYDKIIAKAEGKS